MATHSARARPERTFTLYQSQITTVRDDLSETVLALQQVCRLLDALDSAAPIIPNELAAMLRPYMREIDAAVGELDAWQDGQS